MSAVRLTAVMDGSQELRPWLVCFSEGLEDVFLSTDEPGLESQMEASVPGGTANSGVLVLERHVSQWPVVR